MRALLAVALGLVALTAQANVKPQISGTPPTSAIVGQRYSFVPTVVDPDGPGRKFVIKNRPGWLAFSYQTGRLSGIPTAPGVWKDIIIYVDDGPNTAQPLPRFTITVTATPPNQAPQISGAPVTSVTAGRAYAFQPTATDPNGDPLAFTIANKPSWAAFDAATGRLSGTPQAAAIGTFSNIVIAATDGKASASLPAFSIVVKDIPVASVTLSWTPPTQNTDGTALTNLAGYRIYWGPSAGAMNQTIDVKNAAVAAYVVENLTPGTWYFAVTAYNSTGGESVRSNTASKTTG